MAMKDWAKREVEIAYEEYVGRKVISEALRKEIR